MIPRIIHNIWIQGYDKLSEERKKSYNKIKELNPNWTFIFWDDENIIKLLEKYPTILDIYINVNKLLGPENIYASKGDIARYIIMKDYGGLYFDIDIDCISSFDNLFTKAESKDTIYIASSKIKFLDYFYPFMKPAYCSCFMAFQKDHPIWKNVFDIIINATIKYEIGSALDVSLQKSNQYNIIVLEQIKSCYDCNSKNKVCFIPVESSWSPVRPIIKFINCNFNTIFILIILIIIFWTISRLRKKLYLK